MNRLDKDEEGYTFVHTPDGVYHGRCPVCESSSEIWRYSKDADSPTETAVCCSNGDAFGPQSGLMNEGCLLYMPPEEFYRGTIREAVGFWNLYGTALRQLREDKGC